MKGSTTFPNHVGLSFSFIPAIPGRSRNPKRARAAFPKPRADDQLPEELSLITRGQWQYSITNYFSSRQLGVSERVTILGMVRSTLP